jgi:high-affinity Fe2+/Pb2+ permease
LLVSTFAILLIGDTIYEAGGGKLSNDSEMHVIEFMVVLLVVGLLHSSVMMLSRPRPRSRAA